MHRPDLPWQVIAEVTSEAADRCTLRRAIFCVTPRTTFNGRRSRVALAVQLEKWRCLRSTAPDRSAERQASQKRSGVECSRELRPGDDRITPVVFDGQQVEVGMDVFHLDGAGASCIGLTSIE